MTDLCKIMGSPAELTLECRPSASKYSSVLKAISLVSDQFERGRQLDEYLKGLEEERRKIEAFKRELPFCMHLLNDAIAASKEQLADSQVSEQAPTPTNQVVFSYEEQQYMPASNDIRPVLEEFIPLKKPCDEYGEESEGSHSRHDSKRTKFDNVKKPNWMSSAQLWSQNSEIVECKEERVSPQEKPLNQHDSHFSRSDQEQVFASNSKLFSDTKQRIGGAFLPFSRERQTNPSISVRSNAGKVLPDLALSSGEQEVGSSFRCNEMASLNNATTTTSRSRSKEPTETTTPVLSKEASAKPIVGGCTPAPATSNGAQSGGQSQRKARRCWSPELHRRFVSALQQLGGSQATPKQIRELMKVDGLTNDEVKSHLQKYRLHTRRPSPSPQTSASQAPQLVVLGGIWVPPEYAAHAAAAAHQAPGIYSPLSNTTTSHSQSHYCQSPMPQEYYSQMNQSVPVPHPQLTYCEQQHTPSQSLSSPQGPLQLTGQSSGARGTSADGAAAFRLEKVDISTKRGQAKVLGTIICVGGAMIMTLYKGPTLLTGTLHLLKLSTWIVGAVLLFASTFAWSAWLTFQAPVLKKYPAQKSLTAIILLLGTVQSAVIAIVFEPKVSAWKLNWDIELLSIVYTGVLCSAFAFFVQTYCIHEKGPVFAAVFNPLSTILVAVLDLLILHVNLHLGSVVGGVLIIAGLYTVLWGKAKDKKERPPLEDGLKNESNSTIEDYTVEIKQPLLINETYHQQQSNPHSEISHEQIK